MRRALQACGVAIVVVWSASSFPTASARAQPTAPACGPSWTVLPDPVAEQSSLLSGVHGLSGTDVWAVGTSFPDDVTAKTLTVHWDGSRWTRIPSPNPASWNALVDVAAITDDDAWAVGFYEDPSSIHSLTLTEHWDGKSWQVIPSPSQTDADVNQLVGVTAISSNDVWAVGEYFRASDATPHPIVLHWEGSEWRSISTFAPPHEGSYLNAVDALGSQLWTVGWIGSQNESLAERWNGSRWRRTGTPSPGSQFNLLTGISILNATDVWAVGGFDLSSLAVHWDGHSWTAFPTPNPGTWNTYLDSVKTVATGDVWAVGTYSNQPDYRRRPLIEHWDGQGWSTTPASIGGKWGADLGDVAAVSGSEIWAVGDRITDRHTNTTSTLAMRVCPVQVLDSGFASDAGRVDQGATAAWSFPASDVRAHRVADASGMGLFDSGDRQGGTSFTFAFHTAGAYPIIDLATSSRFRLSIATVAAPPSGNLSTTFTVRWSSDPLADGYAADVQIKRPGETSFSDWLVGQVTAETTFTADAGPGAYEFRARLRSTTNGTATGYSPAGSIAVES